MATITNTEPNGVKPMKSIVTFLLAAFALGGVMDTSAQTKPAASAHAAHAQPMATEPALDISATASPAVAIAEHFGTALAAGDLKTVEALLAPEVLILETGGAERSRAEYMSHTRSAMRSSSRAAITSSSDVSRAARATWPGLAARASSTPARTASR